MKSDLELYAGLSLDGKGGGGSREASMSSPVLRRSSKMAVALAPFEEEGGRCSSDAIERRRAKLSFVSSNETFTVAGDLQGSYKEK